MKVKAGRWPAAKGAWRLYGVLVTTQTVRIGLGRTYVNISRKGH